MINVTDKYTTAEKKTADAAKDPKDQTGEAGKTELSNDAYAVCEFIDALIKKVEQTRQGLIK